ncbi:MAG TPA: Xaa-Pro peptidase family protein [Candidatus Acidoferrum sp.]|nr:Xaa-Pro peptidase family protein [Candidatus Acidoferrum sp.]
MGKLTATRELTIVALLCLGFGAAARAQYTDWKAIEDLGGPPEFAARRAELMAQVKTGYTLLFARNEIAEATHYREDNDFYYYTGVQDPGAVLALDNATGKIFLFEPQQAGRTAQVYGANLLSQPEEAKKLGFDTVLPIGNLDLLLSSALSAHPQVDLWVRLGFPDKADGARGEVGRDHAWKFAHPYHEDVPQDLAPAKLLAERYPMAKLRDVTSIIDAMRNIKRPKEMEVLRRNGKISAEGDRAAIAHARPGMHQYEIEARAYEYFYSHGAQGVAYLAIVGSGKDINTWHYFSNRNVIEANQLVVFDYGASLDHMTMDITRTFNISGKFTPEQAKWYAVDLESQKATIALLKPGHTYEEAEAAGKAVFEKAGIGNQWYGWPGHFVGLATHDVLHPSGPIKPGQVITVEPIVEFPDKQMHFRVEDTILITEGEPEILSAAIPKEITDVEKLVGSEAKEK